MPGDGFSFMVVEKMSKARAVVDRLKEPSTWAGLCGLGVLLGASVEQVQTVAHAGAAVSGLLAVLLGERGA